MPRRLEEMALEELWALFPITLVNHDRNWSRQAREEMARLENILRDSHPVINHIGSTAISSIKSKPIIDLLVEIDFYWKSGTIRKILEDEGYMLMSASDGRMSFNKGYTPEGYADKVFHIHIRDRGDNEEIRFRDYLIDHPDAAREYEALKLSLLLRYRNDRDGYTEAKSDFVRRIKKLSKQ